jgi:hypothetical protein
MRAGLPALGLLVSWALVLTWGGGIGWMVASSTRGSPGFCVVLGAGAFLAGAVCTRMDRDTERGNQLQKA